MRQRIEKRIQRTSDGCWEWQGRLNADGYGRLTIDRKTHYAHRAAFETWIRPLLPNEVVMHRCDNPRCCNPEHLVAGTQAENVADMRSKGRAVSFGRSKKKGGNEMGGSVNPKEGQVPQGLPEALSSAGTSAGDTSVSREA